MFLKVRDGMLHCLPDPECFVPEQLSLQTQGENLPIDWVKSIKKRKQ